jgi:hypothetical protein
VLVPGRQRVVEHAAEQLQRHVLEGESRAVEQFQQVHAAVAQGLHRRDLRRLERGIGLTDQATEGRLVKGSADERAHHPIGDHAIGLALESGNLGL